MSVVLIGSGLTLILAPRHGLAASEAQTVVHRSGTQAPQPITGPPRVRLDGTTFASWALLDRRTGDIVGSPNLAATADTMSMIKAWLAADYLRRLDRAPSPNELHELDIMIKDSDNDAATDIHNRNGQGDGIRRMVSICGLTESRPGDRAYRWSDTVVSARDVVRLGECIADGRAAGPVWTNWLLKQMQQVRGEGDFGLRKAFPADVQPQIAIKNGWFLRPEDGQWHFACLAIGADWVMSALVRYPSKLGEGKGEQLCQAVGTQLLPFLKG